MLTPIFMVGEKMDFCPATPSRHPRASIIYPPFDSCKSACSVLYDRVNRDLARCSGYLTCCSREGCTWAAMTKTASSRRVNRGGDGGEVPDACFQFKLRQRQDRPHPRVRPNFQTACSCLPRFLTSTSVAASAFRRIARSSCFSLNFP